MNEYAILHIPDSRYCFPVSENEVILRLRIDKRDVPDGVFVVYENKYVIQARQRSASALTSAPTAGCARCRAATRSASSR